MRGWLHRPNLTAERVIRQDWPEVFRLGLVLSVCLALPVNAATSMYVHMHTDGGHQTDHHDGRELHRHVGHVEPAVPDHAGKHADPQDLKHDHDAAPSEEMTVAVAMAAWRAAASAVPSGAPIVASSAWLHVPGSSHDLIVPSSGRSTVVPWPPPGVPDSPTKSTPTLRGPPR
jgi:hypothetical protein